MNDIFSKKKQTSLQHPSQKWRFGRSPPMIFSCPPQMTIDRHILNSQTLPRLCLHLGVDWKKWWKKGTYQLFVQISTALQSRLLSPLCTLQLGVDVLFLLLFHWTFMSALKFSYLGLSQCFRQCSRISHSNLKLRQQFFFRHDRFEPHRVSALPHCSKFGNNRKFQICFVFVFWKFRLFANLFSNGCTS